tara:strand:- start:4173 stop:4496 length:324 start_codon:yes stop_codon:yes gene_type:complete
MSKVTVVALVTPNSGQTDMFIEQANWVIPQVHEEDGCLHYSLHRSIDGDDSLVYIESWESEDHLKAHGQAPHMMEFREKVKNLVSGPTQVLRYERADTTGDADKLQL